MQFLELAVQHQRLSRLMSSQVQCKQSQGFDMRGILSK